MKSMKHLAILLLVAVYSTLGTMAQAADLQAGKDYTLINPPLSTPKDKIEVVEYFSYACSHCNDFNPYVTRWEANLPKDVSFRRVHVTFNRAPFARLARINYALELTGELKKYDTAVFNALHVQRMNFNSDEAVMDWAKKVGMDTKKFGEAFNSFGIQNKIQRGDQEASAAGVQGTPALVVAGRYLVKNEAAASYADLLRLADALVAMARQERKGK